LAAKAVLRASAPSTLPEYKKRWQIHRAVPDTIKLQFIGGIVPSVKNQVFAKWLQRQRPNTPWLQVGPQRPRPGFLMILSTARMAASCQRIANSPDASRAKYTIISSTSRQNSGR
jgi:hypothetical protein